MKKLLLFTFAVLLSYAGFTQGSSLYSDDFESYAAGSYIAESNPTWWTTWGGAPGTGEDAYISEDFANSPTKSVFVDPDDGLTDLILKLGNKTSGAYNVDWYIYVETGYQAYYNFQHFESPGIEWAFDVWFYDDGTGEMQTGNIKYPFTYPAGTWFKVEHDINIDADLASLTVNGTIVHEWPFSYESGGTGGTNQLGGVDFWTDDDTYRYYIDDIEYSPMPIVLYEDDFESYELLDYIALSNPTWWTTWGNAPGTGEDGYISGDFAHSPTQSLFIDPDDGLTDLILKLGNKTSGAYNVNWWMYVETGYQAYYNFQHFESPGIEWAFDVWFYDDGTGEMQTGNIKYPFTYTAGAWFMVEHDINIDDDLASLTVNGTVVHEWPFSYESGGTGGTNQLGGVDFWTDDDTYRYYVDDLSYIQLATSQDPAISISPEQLNATGPQGFATTLPLTISNDGVADLTYQVSVIYPMPVQKAAVTSMEGQATPVRSLGYSSQASADPNARPAAYNPVTDDFVLHYDGDNFSAIGWNSVPITPSVAAMFPTNLTLPHAGMMLSSVDIYINDPGTNFVLKIWDMGNSYQPGTLLVSQAFTGTSLTWNSITLNDPVYITGADIWVGYSFTQSVAETFIPGTDGGPANPNGDFISTGVGWSHLSDNPDLDYNWNIRANLTGTPIEQWLSVDPSSGMITPGNSEELTVTFDAAFLEEGTYTATLRVVSNDPENLQIDVPVTFEVTAGGTMTSVILDFEAQEDWSLTFDPWTVVDVDGSGTYGFETIEFPHNYEPMAFIAFNPATTIPPMTDDAEIQPHGGVRFGACMASADPTYLNDDWLISPMVDLGMNSSVTFWVKSYTAQYGLERYNVLVSTTDNEPGSFTSISGPTYMEAPAVWTEVSYDLSMYDGQAIYVAIQCVTADAFIFMVDDISIDFIVGTPEQPANVEIAVYPNPVTDHMNIVSGVEMTQVEIFNQLGQVVYSQVVKDTNFNLNTANFNAGVYFVRITTDQGISTKKIMIK
jgi:hypothetical protein